MPKITDPALLQQLNGGQPAAPPRPMGGIPTFQVPQSQAQIDEEARKRAAEGRAQTDQMLQIQAAQRAIEAAARDAKKFQQEQTDRTTGANVTEAERTASFLATRLAGGIDDINAALKKYPGQSGPTLATTAANVFGAGNLVNPVGRKLIEDAQKDILDSALTLGTGAAYTPVQLESYRESYFPRYGDDPEQIEAKRTRLLRLLEAAKLKAGRSAPQIDAALSAFRAAEEPPKTEVVDPVTAASNALRGDGPNFTVDITAPDLSRLSPEDRAQYQRLLDNPSVPPQALEAFLNSRGVVLGQEKQYEPGARELAGQITELQGESGLGGIARQGLAPLADEAAGLGNALGQLLGGDSDFARNYRMGRDAERIRIDEAIAKAGGLGTVAELLGSLGMVRPGTPLSGSLFKQGAIGGGTAGAITGFGQGEGLQDSAERAAVGGGGGAVVGGSLGALGDRLARPAPPPPGGQNAVNVATAASQEGVPVSRPIIDPGRRDRMAFLESSPGSGNRIREGLEATRQGIETRAGELGARGTAQAPEALGQNIQGAGQRFINRSRDLKNNLYRVAERLAGDRTVNPSEALANLDAQIAELSRTPNANKGVLEYLQTVRGDLVDEAGNIKPLTVADIRRIRTGMRGEINQRNLRMSDAERRVTMALDAARTDIARDLGQQAPAAVRAYSRADKFNRQRAEEIDQVIQRFTGPKDNPISGEKALENLKAMASPKGDIERLSRMMSKFTPDERDDIAATIADSLGRRSPEDEFSPALFVSQTRALSPRARTLIFGEDGARSLGNLRSLSAAYRDTVGRLNNSRSGVVQNWGQFLRQFAGGGTLGTLAGMAGGAGGLTTGATGLALGAASAAGGAGIRNLSARALMNPDVSRWVLAGARANTPRAIGQHIEELGTIAARNPQIANDVLGLQAQLQQALGASPVRQAAADESDNGR